MQDTENTITSAVERLNHILPLKARQDALDTPLQRLHRAILQTYIDIGRSLNRNEITRYADNIDEAVRILKHNDLVIFDESGEPTGAYPFTMEEREHIVDVNGHTVHCMCALDALAVSPMFNMPTKITSRCYVTSDPIVIQQQGLMTSNQSEASNIYFGINWSAASGNSCCASSLCTEMIFLKNKKVAESWLSESPEQQQTFHLSDAIDFAARFFVPLIGESTKY